MSDMLFDQETGEIASTTETAVQVRKEAELVVIKAGMELFSALHNAVSKMPVWITTDEEGDLGKFKVKYASLKKILQVTRPILLAEGIRIRQGASPSWNMDAGSIKGKLVPVYTDLIHSVTGQVDRTTIEIPLSKLDAQGMGSAVSYGRRYSLLAALGLATDESDDNGKKTVAPDVMTEHIDSNELLGFRDEINAIDDFKKLKEWGEKLKTSRRAESLDEGEAALLRKYFSEALRKLSEPKASK
jgi:ERF superfamily